MVLIQTELAVHVAAVCGQGFMHEKVTDWAYHGVNVGLSHPLLGSGVFFEFHFSFLCLGQLFIALLGGLGIWERVLI